MTPAPIWFGPRERPLAGFLHVPAGPAIGGVLVCPPFGYEAICAHRTLRTVAERLAARGHLVLRFDYEGTGASSGPAAEAGALDHWQASVTLGIAELRRRGVRRPALVGLRLGAALALAATRDDPDLGPLALWAPVTSGRRYWRELRAQAAITPGGVPGDGSLNVVGHQVPAGAIRSLKAWDPLAGAHPAAAVAVVQSPGWRDADETATELTTAGLHAEFLDLDGTSAVLERDAEMVEVPMRLVDGLCRWLHSAAEADPIEVTPLSADHVRSLDGGIEEEIVSVGRRGLYGVLTRPALAPSGAGIVFLNNGVAPAAGPARAWVEFARMLAAEGVTSLRLDFSGLGDSPDPGRRRAVRRERAVPRTAGAELLAAADLLRGRGVETVTAVGLCSGAQISVRTAAYGDGIDVVFAINPPLFYLCDQGIGPWQRRLWALTAFPMSKRPVRAAMHRLPEPIWTWLDRLGLFPSPARYLRRARARGTRMHLVFSAGDPGLHDLQVRAGRAVTRLVARGGASLLVVEGMDHSMFDRARRAEVLDALRAACGVRSAQALDRYASG